MQISPAIVERLRGRSRPGGARCWLLSARAAASAYAPPDPIARIPSSGSMMSPVPEMMNPCCRSSHGEQRFQPPQDPITSPVLGQLDGRFRHVPREPLEFLLELLEQRKGVRRRPGKAGQQLAAAQRAHFLRVRLHDRFADRDLAVTAERDLAVPPYREDRRRVDSRDS